MNLKFLDVSKDPHLFCICGRQAAWAIHATEEGRSVTLIVCGKHPGRQLVSRTTPWSKHLP